MSDRNRALFAALLIVAIAGAGSWTILYATHPGIGLDSDTTYYLDVARRLLAGHGYTILDIHRNVDPFPLFPFVYPTLLALPGPFGCDLVAGARWVGAIVGFANVVLLGAISYRRCCHSIGAAVLAAFWGCASFDLLTYHTFALSDTPCLTFVLLAFLFMGNYLEKPAPGSLASAAAATALAFATRYAAAAFVLAGFAAILLWEKRALAKRLLNAVLFGLGSSSLMILWILRNMHYHRGATGRYLDFHPVMEMAQLQNILLAVSTWASNGSLEMADACGRVPIVGAAILLALAAARASRRKTERDLGTALPLTYIFSYVVVLLLSWWFLEADLFLDSLRILLPIHVFMIILVVYVGNRFYRGLELGIQKAAVSVLCVVVSVFFLAWMTGWARDYHDEGQGFADSAYTNSEMLKTIRGLPKDARFYSNNPWPIGIYTDRLWEQLPSKIDTSTLKEDKAYRAVMENIARTMREPDVYLAYFKEGDDWFVFPSVEEIQSYVPLRAVAETQDGTIYEAARKF